MNDSSLPLTAEGAWDAPYGAGPAAWIAWINRLPQLRQLGMVCTDLDAGEAIFSLEEVPLGPNPDGAVNGGLVAAVVDQAMGAVAMLNVPGGHVINTASLNVQFLRPARVPLTVRGVVAKPGRRLIFVEVEVSDRDGQVTNLASGTMVVVPVGSDWSSPA
jgi:uncharacterized protein (TIGR00369 family)